MGPRRLDPSTRGLLLILVTVTVAVAIFTVGLVRGQPPIRLAGVTINFHKSGGGIGLCWTIIIVGWWLAISEIRQQLRPCARANAPERSP